LEYNLTLINETGEKIGDIKSNVEEGLDLVNNSHPTLMTGVAARNAKIVIASNSGDFATNGNSVTIEKQALGERTQSLLRIEFKSMMKLDPQLSAANQNVR
jgi:hypothetical protein